MDVLGSWYKSVDFGDKSDLRAVLAVRERVLELGVRVELDPCRTPNVDSPSNVDTLSNVDRPSNVDTSSNVVSLSNDDSLSNVDT